MSDEHRAPKVFISYAWEDDLKTWVLNFATRLRSDGINAILDQWETVPGDQLPEFMEKSVRESGFVIFVCTPTYKRKSDRRKGGVGYEGHIITGEVFQKSNHRKFIPVLRKGKWAAASPSWATSKLFIDFRGEPYSEANYQQLLNTLFGKSPTAPPIRDDTWQEKFERESVEKTTHEQIERESLKKSEQQKLEREKKEHESAEKANVERVQQEVTEKATRDKVERDFIKTIPPNIPIDANRHISPTGLVSSPKSNSFEPIDVNSNSIVKAGRLNEEEQLEKERIEQEEIGKRRLPYFETMAPRNIVSPQDRENSANVINKSTEDTPLRGSSVSPEFRASLEQVVSKKSRGKRLIKTEYVVAIIIAAATIMAGVLGSPLIEKLFSAVPVATELVTATFTLTTSPSPQSQILYPIEISETPTITVTPTEIITPTATSLPTEITDAKGMSMVLVPAGEFMMGVDPVAVCQGYTRWLDCQETYRKNEPLQSVFLDTYYIDRYEVTNAKYEECVFAQQCKRPISTKLGDLFYYGNESYDNYPVVYVSREMARQYCTWRGAYLPSSMQWEKAARGTDQRLYPWGNESEWISRANGPGGEDGYQVTSPVGSFPSGESPYRVYDMAGNVQEIVSSDINYYTSDKRTYTYPMTRGGDWCGITCNGLGTLSGLFTYSIGSTSSDSSVNNWDGIVGFRCAKDAKP